MTIISFSDTEIIKVISLANEYCGRPYYPEVFATTDAYCTLFRNRRSEDNGKIKNVLFGKKK